MIKTREIKTSDALNNTAVVAKKNNSKSLLQRKNEINSIENIHWKLFFIV